MSKEMSLKESRRIVGKLGLVWVIADHWGNLGREMVMIRSEKEKDTLISSIIQGKGNKKGFDELKISLGSDYVDRMKKAVRIYIEDRILKE